MAAARGGDDGDAADSPTSAAPATSEGSAASTTAGGTATTAAGATPTSLAEWESLWASERAAIVKRIKDNHWGLSADGKTLTGPEGWTVDLTKCVADWSDTEGLSDTSIKIGASLSLSGTYADYGNYGKGSEFLFGYYSDQGFFKDASNGKVRKVNYIMKDDGYDTARAIPNVDELLDSEKVFAIWTLGTPATLKTYDKINQRCVPHPMAIRFHSAWGDPVNHPWTTGAPSPTYSTEAILWGAFIERHLDEFPTDRKIKVAGPSRTTISASRTTRRSRPTWRSRRS